MCFFVKVGKNGWRVLSNSGWSINWIGNQLEYCCGFRETFTCKLGLCGLNDIFVSTKPKVMPNYLKALLLALVFVVSGCKDDKEEDKVFVDPAEAVERNLFLLEDCAAVLHDGDFAQLVKLLTNDTETDGVDFTWLEEVLDILSEQYFSDYPFYDNNEINFQNYEGVYTWDASSDQFTKVASPGKMEVLVSGSYGSSSNDFRLVLEGLSETTARIDGEQFQVPTGLTSSVYWKNTRIAGLTIDHLTIDPTGNTTLPVSFRAEVYTAPFTHTFQVSRSDSKNYQARFEMENNGGCSYELFVSAVSNVSTYENFELEENLVSASGYFDAQGLKYQFAMNGAIMQLDDPTNAEINEYIDVDLYSGGEKIGELFLNADDQVMLVSNDGTQTNAEDLLMPHLEAIENLFSDFE